jgi:hypothetical protein
MARLMACSHKLDKTDRFEWPGTPLRGFAHPTAFR